MARRTWFLPPHFSFLPEGELSLGTVISHPSRPTRILTVLNIDQYPDIVLPKVTNITETNHRHGSGSKRLVGGGFFAKVVDLASASGSANLSDNKIESLGEVDLEIRAFEKSLSADALLKVVELDPVKKHMKQSMLGNRPFYIISGLRVAKESFEVICETTSTVSASAEISGPAPAEPLPLEAGANGTASREKSRVDGYKTAPGVVYAYQVHVIRVKRNGNATTELFSHKTAFLTGESEDEEDEEPLEMECIEVNADVIGDDMELVTKFDEHSIGLDQESCIVFKDDL
ncbi:hypothetical protein PG985_002381 [Apiospora marii]|uniref:uncharacterized protein n=1 Tax=Apiospora marii TaxID=335849 RepID=UPI0031312F69